MSDKPHEKSESQYEGRKEAFMDVDRMINEGLGGGQVTQDNGLIEESTTDTMEHPESILSELKEDEE